MKKFGIALPLFPTIHSKVQGYKEILAITYLCSINEEQLLLWSVCSIRKLSPTSFKLVASSLNYRLYVPKTHKEIGKCTKVLSY